MLEGWLTSPLLNDHGSFYEIFEGDKIMIRGGF